MAFFISSFSFCATCTRAPLGILLIIEVDCFRFDKVSASDGLGVVLWFAADAGEGSGLVVVLR